MLQSNKDTTRRLKSASELGTIIHILEGLIDSGLHGCAPPPTNEIRSLLSSMKKHVANAKVQVKALESLVELTTKKEWAISIAKAGGARIVTEAMRIHPHDVNVQEVGCALLANIADIARTLVKRAGGIQILVNAMKKFKEHASIQLSACRAISASICTQAEAEGIAPMGVIDHVLKAMKAYPNHAEVQEMCCKALASLSMSDNGALGIAETGGIDLIVGAMDRNPHRASLQEHACHAIFNLGFLDGKKQNIRISMADVGRVNPILSALKLQTDDENVQQQGYEALSALVHDNGTPNKGFCDLMKQEHDVMFVINAMKKYIGNQRLQFACLRVCQALMVSDLELTRAIAKAGIVELTLAAMREHPDCAVLQGEGLYALGSFSDCGGSIRDRIVVEGAIDFVMSAMQRHEHNLSVQKKG